MLRYSLDVEGDDDGEDRVRPAGLGVHVGGRHRPGLVALRHQVLDTLSVQHGQLRETFHIGPQHLVFPGIVVVRVRLAKLLSR